MRKICATLALFFALAVPALAAGVVFTEPYLLTLKPATEMNVCWLTDSPAETWVEFGEAASLGATVVAKPYEIKGIRTSARPDGYDPDPAKNPELPVRQHIATLTGLKPATTYHYRVMTKFGSKTIEGRQYDFRTAPEQGKAFSLILLSDLQQKAQIRDTVRLAGQQGAQCIIYNGDFQNTPWKAGEWFPVEGCFVDPKEKGKEWFPTMQQTEGGARLLQHVPFFPCPGNHEADDQRIWTDKTLAQKPELKTLSIYLQLFRPLYPEQQAQRNGKHWYSADFGDLHIVSLSVIRWHPWNGFEAPGWFPLDDITSDSPQVRWLEKDLAEKKTRYIWVTQHWHMLNRGADGWTPFSEPLTDPVSGDMAIYPHGDLCWTVLRPIYEKNGVNAVSFGHSHVYERYLINGVNYVEAASIGNNYRAGNDPHHFSGNRPVIEENRFRSFLLVNVTPEKMEGRGIRASADGGDGVKVGEAFDAYVIAK